MPVGSVGVRFNTECCRHIWFLYAVYFCVCTYFVVYCTCYLHRNRSTPIATRFRYITCESIKRNIIFIDVNAQCVREIYSLFCLKSNNIYSISIRLAVKICWKKWQLGKMETDRSNQNFNSIKLRSKFKNALPFPKESKICLLVD